MTLDHFPLDHFQCTRRDRPKEFLQKQKALNVRWPLSAETRKKQKGQKAQKYTERLEFLQKQPLSLKNWSPHSAEIAKTLSWAFSTPIFCRKQKERPFGRSLVPRMRDCPTSCGGELTQTRGSLLEGFLICFIDYYNTNPWWPITSQTWVGLTYLYLQCSTITHG